MGTYFDIMPSQNCIPALANGTKHMGHAHFLKWPSRKMVIVMFGLNKCRNILRPISKKRRKFHKCNYYRL